MPEVRPRYEESAGLFIALCLIPLLAVLAYRAEIYLLSLPVYGGLFHGFRQYLFLSLSRDAAVILISQYLMLVIFMTAGPERRLSFIIIAFVMALEMVFFQLSIEFFKVYERTFHPLFLSRENRTGVMLLLESVISELSWAFYLKAVVLPAIVAATATASFRAREPIFRFARSMGERRIPRAILYGAPIIMALLIGIPALTVSLASRGTLPARGKELNDAAVRSDLLSNPILNCLSGREITRERPVGDARAATAFFGTRLNTASLNSTRFYGSTNIIPRNRRYNVIFYFFESTSHRYLDHETGGRRVMETWSRLMKHSLIAERHYANYPLSANALFSVLCAAYGRFDRDNVIQTHPSIPVKSISEVLHDHGYRTFLIHTGELGYAGQNRFLRHRKFDTILEMIDLKDMPPYNRRVGWGFDERIMTVPAIDFIEKDRTSPFFMVFMPVNPHHPYAIPGEQFDITGSMNEEGDTRVSWRHYLNSLHFADRALGDLIDALERRGHLENTLVFIFADHGEAFYQHRMNYNHPFFLYQENVHVPFIIYNKTIFKEPYRYGAISRHIDISPTLLEVLGFPEYRSMEGVPMLAPHREQMALLHTFWKDEYIAVRDSRWKYILRTGDGFEELYDLEEDPEERRNRSDTETGITAKYRDFASQSRKYNRYYYDRVLSRKGK
jgi:arylsulfatase A-like enzyme